MPRQQKTQKKKTWRTPEIVVLIRNGDGSAGVLHSCRMSTQTQENPAVNHMMCIRTRSQIMGCISSCKDKSME
jgi:hypothetical protein